MADQQGAFNSQSRAQTAKILREQHPAKPSFLGIALPMITKVRRDNPVRCRKTPGDRMPYPWHKTGRVEKYNRGPVTFIQQVLHVDIAYVLRTNLRHYRTHWPLLVANTSSVSLNSNPNRSER
jgi:hypothetical protein